MGKLEVKHTFELNSPKLTVKGGLPKRYYYNDMFDVAVDCFDEVIFDGRSIPLFDMPADEKKKVLEKLPSFVFPDVLKYLQTQDMIIITLIIKGNIVKKSIMFHSNNLKSCE